MTFTADVSANEFTIDDFTTTGTNINIIDIIKVAVDGLITDATIEFNFLTDNTAAADITIDAGKIGNADQTNDEAIIISIDKAPRVVSIGNSEALFNSDFSYTFTFSEAINGLDGSDFVITPADSGVTAQTVSFTDNKTATVTFTVADDIEIDDTFSINLPNNRYTDDGNNGNNETTGANAVLPLNIVIDTIAPRITSIDGETEFNNSEVGTEISYTLTFSEAINGLETGDFVITPADSGVSAQLVSFTDNKTATVTFTVTNAEIDTDFSITLPNNSYTDQAGNGNREITETEAVLPIEITIDTIAPTIISPVAGDYPVTTNPFTLTIDFSEELNLTNNTYAILTASDITLTNATITDPITVENSGGTGRVVIKAMIDDLSGDRPTITGGTYSDALGNEGESDYTFTIKSEVQETYWLTENDCEKFSFDGGDGSTDTPYQISNICQLQNIDDNTIDSLGYSGLLTKNYKLTQNIEASYTVAWNDGTGFNPIGYYNSDTDNAGFDGTFDGGGFTLSTLTIDRTTNYIGLLGYNGGTIKDITLDSVDITGNNFVGGLVGYNDVLGSIMNSNSDGSVVGTNSIGGLVGSNRYSIINSSFSGSIVGANSIGGLAGSNASLIMNSSASGSVKGKFSRVGGLVGFNHPGTIENSTSSGSVDGSSDVGGFVGWNTGTIEDSTSDGNVSGSGSNIGGFVGNYTDSFNFGRIENSSSSGSVGGTGSNIGGFVGVNTDGNYTNDTWCVVGGSSLLDSGNEGDIDEITEVDANCQ